MNPNPNPAQVVDNPILISRRSKRQESLVSPTPSIKANSHPDECLFLEDLPFGELFDLSIFKTRSESALDDIVLDPKFVVDLEVQKENQSIDEYILNSPLSSLTIAKIPEPFELVSTTLSSPLFPSTSEIHSSPPFIRSLPYQPINTHKSPITPSFPSTIVSSPSTPTPLLSLAQLRAMENRYAPLALPAPLGAMP